MLANEFCDMIDDLISDLRIKRGFVEHLLRGCPTDKDVEEFEVGKTEVEETHALLCAVAGELQKWF